MCRAETDYGAPASVSFVPDYLHDWQLNAVTQKAVAIVGFYVGKIYRSVDMIEEKEASYLHMYVPT